jgi:imidazolonepropionase-like amidohydrolase
VAAAFRAWEALNPASALWAPATNEGITTVAVLPGGGFVAGQAAVVDTARGAGGAMVRRAPVAMVVNLTSLPGAETGARAEMMGRLRELLSDAQVYRARRDAFESGNTRAFAAGKAQLEALVPVVEGTLPLFVGVDRASDIEAVLGLAGEFKLKIAILGGAEAWLVADKLAAANVPVVTGALENIPSSFATLGARQENAALLRKAGVRVAIIAGEGESFNVRNVRQHAGNAVAYGLSWDEALRAVTLTPAELLGVDAAIGTLQPGRDANVVVWDGDPFELTTNATHVFVGGRSAKTTSRQDLLTDRYKPKKP